MDSKWLGWKLARDGRENRDKTPGPPFGFEASGTLAESMVPGPRNFRAGAWESTCGQAPPLGPSKGSVINSVTSFVYLIPPGKWEASSHLSGRQEGWTEVQGGCFAGITGLIPDKAEIQFLPLLNSLVQLFLGLSSNPPGFVHSPFLKLLAGTPSFPLPSCRPWFCPSASLQHPTTS